jgi:dephospho-CoA kinase
MNNEQQLSPIRCLRHQFGTSEVKPVVEDYDEDLLWNLQRKKIRRHYFDNQEKNMRAENCQRELSETLIIKTQIHIATCISFHAQITRVRLLFGDLCWKFFCLHH